MRRLLEWKYMNPQTNTTASAVSNKQTTNNYPSQEADYKKLLDQIDKENVFMYSTKKLTDRILEADLWYNVRVFQKISIVYYPYVPEYTIRIYDESGTEVSKTECKTFEEVLDVLIRNKIIKDKSFYSAASVAEEFEVYNNLWSK